MENIPTVFYKAGEVIIREGDPSNSVFLIVSGKVKITKSAGKQQVPLATQGKNTIFGEMTLIDGKNRSASVTAVEDTYCYKCSAVALVREIGKMDVQLRHTLESLVSMIRHNNFELISQFTLKSTKKNPDVIDDEEEDDDSGIKMSEAQIHSPEIQDKIANIDNAFIRSLFRVLMATAFKKHGD